MVPDYVASFGEGFLLGIGLIVGIGPQNMLVLRQSLRRQHLSLMVGLCSLIDASLIALGTAGVGAVFRSEHLLLPLSYASVSLLLVCSLRSFGSALGPDSRLGLTDLSPSSRQVVVMLLTVSLLNPVVYLDTMLLIGMSASGYPHEARLWFAAGAICASVAWFSGLSYGSARLAPLFKRRRTLRVLDLCSGSILCYMALRLLP